MRQRAAGFAFVLLLGAVVVAQTQAADPSKLEVVPIDQEPSHHLVFENEYVRVFSVEVAPHSETKYHQHDRDYVFVTLGDSDVESVRLNGPTVHLQPKDGETQFTKGGFAHKAVNKSDKPFRNVTVELKKPTFDLKIAALGHEVPCEGEAAKDPSRKCYQGARSGGWGSCSHCECRGECFETKPLLTGQSLEIDEAIIPRTGKYFDSAYESPRMLIALKDGAIGIGKSEKRPDGTWSIITWASEHREVLKARSVRWLADSEFEIYPVSKKGTRIVVFNFKNDETQGPSRQNGGPPGDGGPSTRR